MNTYFYYTCQGYDIYDKSQDLFMRTLNVRVIAENEKDALKKAATLVKKPNWRVIEVGEHFPPKE